MAGPPGLQDGPVATSLGVGELNLIAWGERAARLPDHLVRLTVPVSRSPPGRLQAPPSLVARPSLLSPGGAAPLRLSLCLRRPRRRGPDRWSRGRRTPARRAR